MVNKAPGGRKNNLLVINKLFFLHGALDTRHPTLNFNNNNNNNNN